MRVVDWYKWTRFKKRVSISLVLFGILLSFGMEKGSLLYGLWGLGFAGAGVLIAQSINRDEW